MNWGNEGIYDGYFTMTNFSDGDDIYSGMQIMIYNLVPDDDAIISRPQASVVKMNCSNISHCTIDNVISSSYYGCERISSAEDFPTFNVSATIKNNSSSKLQVGLALYDNNGLVKVLNEGTHVLTSNSTYDYNTEITINASIPQGEYRIVSVRNSSTDEWLSNYYSMDRFITANVGENKLTLDLLRHRTVKDSIDIEGINYYLFTYCGNNYARAIFNSNQSLSSDIIIPNSVTYNGDEYEINDVWIEENSELTSLDVSNCRSLYNLFCTDNKKLTKISMGNCGVESAYVCNNPLLSSFDTSKCKNLRELYCYDCALTTLDLSQCGKLKELACFNNALTTLNLSGCSMLTYLSCYNNALASLALSDCPSLETLKCSNNQLTSLDLRKCNNLETFEYSGNEPTLQKLLLGKSKIKELSFGSNSVLTTLDVSQCDSLETLKVSNGKLTTLTLGSNKNLETLNCTNNQLSQLDLSQCENLKTLNCTENQLTSLDVSGCKVLESLECASWNLDGEITSLNVSDCSMLTSLDCRGNKLTSLDLSGCTALSSLDCSSNNILLLDFKDNLNLTTVDCSFNRISEFKNYEDIPFTSFDANYNSFGFSQATPRMYELLQKCAGGVYSGSGLEYYNIYWRPQKDLYVGDVLDLSKEMIAYDGSPCTIIV